MLLMHTALHRLRKETSLIL